MTQMFKLTWDDGLGNIVTVTNSSEDVITADMLLEYFCGAAVAFQFAQKNIENAIIEKAMELEPGLSIPESDQDDDGLMSRQCRCVLVPVRRNE